MKSLLMFDQFGEGSMFMLGAFIWWEVLLLVALGFAFFVCIIKEADELAVFDFVVTVAICQWLLKIDIWSWLLTNYTVFLLYLLVYFVCGAGWSIFKWFRLVKGELKKYRHERILFLKTFKVAENIIPIEYQKMWEDVIRGRDWPPSPGSHKADLTRWIIAWPVSVLWAVLEDFFVWVGEKLYTYISDIYKTISNRMFAEMGRDLRKGTEKEEKGI